ncbi:hypothetical protein ACFLZB_04035 [Nanoarchaeota archaeon]
MANLEYVLGKLTIENTNLKKRRCLLGDTIRDTNQMIQNTDETVSLLRDYSTEKTNK